MIISVIFACDASYCFSKKLMFPTECPKEGKEKRRNIRKPQKIHGKKKKGEKVLHAVSVYLKTKLLDSFNPYFPSK